MSAWGKFLPSIDIPTGGYTLAWTGSGATTEITVPAGAYDTIIDLCEAIEDELQALGAGPPSHIGDLCSVTSVGRVVLLIGGITAEDWSNTDDELEELLGFDGTEDVSGGLLTGNEQHQHGWYPGVLGRGESDGEGLSSDTGWHVADKAGVILAGNGAAAIIAPTRRAYRRRIRFSSVKLDEVFDRYKGPKAFEDLWATRVIAWYLDRDDGVVGTPGTQGDPGDPWYHSDSDCDFYEVTVQDIRITDGSTRSLKTIELELNAEPRES